MAEKEQEAPQAPPADSKAGANKLLLPMVGVNSLVTVGLMVMLLLRPAGGTKRAAAAEAAPPAPEPAAEPAPHAPAAKSAVPGPTVRLPDFVVHLRDSDADRYARITMEMEVADEKAKELLAPRVPQIRDAFISYLSDRSIADLRGSDAISRVKFDLSEKLKLVAPDVPVRNLYVTDLVVQ